MPKRNGDETEYAILHTVWTIKYFGVFFSSFVGSFAVLLLLFTFIHTILINIFLCWFFCLLNEWVKINYEQCFLFLPAWKRWTPCYNIKVKISVVREDWKVIKENQTKKKSFFFATQNRGKKSSVKRKKEELSVNFKWSDQIFHLEKKRENATYSYTHTRGNDDDNWIERPQSIITVIKAVFNEI